MLDRLPLELVCDILRIAAVMCLPTDRQTIRNIALSCSLAYGSVIPVLYSAFVIDEKNKKHVGEVFEDSPPLASGVFSIAPSQRLCPHIRRVFVETKLKISSRQLSLLVNLRSIFSLSLDFDALTPESLPDPVPSLEHFYVLSVDYPPSLPPSVTHVSYYIHIPAPASITVFEDYAKRVFSDTITHVAIELNESIVPSYETPLLSLLKALLGRNSSAPVVLRLYRNAGDNDCERVVLRAIARLELEPLRRRVLLWRDPRPIFDTKDDINISKMDCIVGRTPWEEAEPVSHAELEVAENWQEPPTPVQENEIV